MKRVMQRVKHPMRGKVSDSVESIVTLDGMHETTAEYAGSAGSAMIQEVSHYIQGDEGDAALRKLFLTQATAVAEVVSKLLLSDDVQTALRSAGVEIVSGSYQGIGQVLSQEWERLPRSVIVSLSSILGTFVGLFLVGLLLALWRFALFGLH